MGALQQATKAWDEDGRDSTRSRRPGSASMRAEEALQELRRSNVELLARSRELETRALELELKNRDIARARATLEDKAGELARTSQHKSDFLASMSHELRTPLNSMLILAGILADNDDRNLTPKQVEYARTISSAGQELLSLINEILDLSKIEAGRIEIQVGPALLEEVCAQVERTFHEVATQRHLAFEVHLSPELPPAILTDSHRLQQILKNLLSNAFKFTEEGTVSLDVFPTSRDAPGVGGEDVRDTAIAFAVSDTGIGIPADRQQLIFDAFRQGDASTCRTYGGTGLGLTISRELAYLLGGAIHLTSAEGAGSIFTLTLPLAIADAGMPLTEVAPRKPRPGAATGQSGLRPRAAGAAEPLAGRTVLVVDDDARNVFAVSSLLAGYGARVLFAERARDGIELLEENPDVDLLLMDIMMPEMDGYEAARQIRQTPKFAALPIVAVTARAMQGDRARCLAAGCSDFVPKPVDNAHLVAVVRRWLRAAPSGRR